MSPLQLSSLGTFPLGEARRACSPPSCAEVRLHIGCTKYSGNGPTLDQWGGPKRTRALTNRPSLSWPERTTVVVSESARLSMAMDIPVLCAFSVSTARAATLPLLEPDADAAAHRAPSFWNAKRPVTPATTPRGTQTEGARNFGRRSADNAARPRGTVPVKADMPSPAEGAGRPHTSQQKRKSGSESCPSGIMCGAELSPRAEGPRMDRVGVAARCQMRDP